MSSIQDRRAEIKEIVCDVLEIDPDEIKDSSLFKEEYGADSLRSIEVLAALEKNFRVEIDQAELARMVNLEGVYSVVEDAAK
ncbi:acyl carrier protein [Streptomyces sp. DconLS]|uniref:acyl carrier protein n=1 Tax=Streptomyces TaxID=1883 RepID=UPI00081DF369|nr:MULTISPECIES: acyl carrier protein [unclassified Streptomyces]SCG01262.1 acyl carrier protein [Streptomyces sp. DconLS]SCG05662.1 acyl carrier protein [Streptomyces sp. LamerLS-31b]